MTEYLIKSPKRQFLQINNIYTRSIGAGRGERERSEMGSLDKYCRLCATNVRPDTLVKLYAETNTGRSETNNVAKLRNFLQFNISAEDRLPKSVCVQCITNLDYCIQFVDR